MVRASAVGLILILSFFSSCSENNNKPEDGALTYFDIKGYFEQEATRLSQKNPLVYKEIIKNSEKEAQEIRINDWNKEFSFFIESDINKPAWTSSYSVKKNKDTIIYSALDPELRTKQIKLLKNANKLLFLSIKNEATNKLYTSKEELYYFPDSIYKLIKNQQVRIIGENHYQITVKFTE